MESNEPAFILATSGTTARPKLAVHTHGGYQVHIVCMAQWCFGLKPEDVWWSTSDIGWVVGHSYIVYAPLVIGATTLAYEGAIDHPAPDAVWRIVEEFGVTGIFTSPTAVRLLMRYGEQHARGCDLSTLDARALRRRGLERPGLGMAAEESLRRPDPGDRSHVANRDGRADLRQSLRTRNASDQAGLLAEWPLPGIEPAVVTAEGEPCRPGEKGIMVLKRPFPGLTPTLWGEPERYARDYWERLPGVYYTGDSAHVDEDGYVWFAGRADEIIKIAGPSHRHHRGRDRVLETPGGCGGRRHRTARTNCGAKSSPPSSCLKDGHSASAALKTEIIETIRRELGPIAVIGELNFVNMLPKTRSGKIMRRVSEGGHPRQGTRRHHHDRGRGLGRGRAPRLGRR